jgi:SAM-dependent methyltransferase
MLTTIRKKLGLYKWNAKLDAEVASASFESIGIKKRIVNKTELELKNWLLKGNLDLFVKSGFITKKGMEFYFSAQLLEIRPEHAVLDAAGGRSDYLKAVQANHNTKKLYLTDHIFSGVREENGVHIVGGDISSIDLPNSSIDRVACHHAFEHFQEDKDWLFIKEAFRLLKNGGVLLIIPIFIANKYVECWNVESTELFDEKASLLVDGSASLPGADEDGHFARIYDNENLLGRIIGPAQELGFDCEICECQIGGKPVPNLEKDFGTALNRPLRALRCVKE